MVKKIIYNIITAIILIIVANAIIKANKPFPKLFERGALIKNSQSENPADKSGLVPQEAKYYRVIQE